MLAAPPAFLPPGPLESSCGQAELNQARQELCAVLAAQEALEAAQMGALHTEAGGERGRGEQGRGEQGSRASDGGQDRSETGGRAELAIGSWPELGVGFRCCTSGFRCCTSGFRSALHT